MKVNKDLTIKLISLIQQLSSLEQYANTKSGCWTIGDSQQFSDWCAKFTYVLSKLPQTELVSDLRVFLNTVRWSGWNDKRNFQTLKSKVSVLRYEFSDIMCAEDRGGSTNIDTDNSTTSTIGKNLISGNSNTTIIINESQQPQKPIGFWEKIFQEVSIKVILSILGVVATAAISFVAFHLNNDNVENNQDYGQVIEENETPAKVENDSNADATVEANSANVMLKLEKETAYLEEHINVFVNSSEPIQRATLYSKSETTEYGPFIMNPANDSNSYGFVAEFFEPGVHTITAEVIVEDGEIIEVSESIEVLNIVAPEAQEIITEITISN